LVRATAASAGLYFALLAAHARGCQPTRPRYGDCCKHWAMRMQSDLVTASNPQVRP